MQEHKLMHTTHIYKNKLTKRIIFGLAKKEKVRVHVQNKMLDHFC